MGDVNVAGSIAILLAIGLVMGAAIISSLIFYLKQRKTRHVDREFRERFGSPIVLSRNVSMLVHSANGPSPVVGPALPPFGPNGQTIHPTLLAKKQLIFPDRLSAAVLAPSGPLAAGHVGCLHSSLQCSNSTLAALKQLQTTQKIQYNAGEQRKLLNTAEKPGTSTVTISDVAQASANEASAGTSSQDLELALIPAYFGNKNYESTIPEGLDTSASLILQDPIAVSTSVDAALPTVVRTHNVAHFEQSACTTPRRQSTHLPRVHQRRGTLEMGPLARSVSNLSLNFDRKALTTPSGTVQGAKVGAVAGLGDTSNPFATTSTAIAAHKQAILELEAAQLGMVLVKVRRSSTDGTPTKIVTNKEAAAAAAVEPTVVVAPKAKESDGALQEDKDASEEVTIGDMTEVAQELSAKIKELAVEQPPVVVPAKPKAEHQVAEDKSVPRIAEAAETAARNSSHEDLKVPSEKAAPALQVARAEGVSSA